jgi:exonuclease III
MGLPSMRIVTWNIRAGGGRRVKQIASHIERWHPDIAVLTEFRATPPSCRLADALAAQGLAHQRSALDAWRSSANGLLVAARWPLRPIALRRRPEERERWLCVRVEAPEPFALGAMHVPNRVSGRKDAFHAAVLDLARRWRGGPALLTGDTNSGRIGLDEEVPCFSAREDGWMTALDAAGWHDAFRRLHGDDARAYTWYSPNAGNGFRLDETFVHRSLAPNLIGAAYEWAQAPDSPRRDAVSDHAALIVDLAPSAP